MKKIDPIIVKETKYVAAWIVILSMLMQSVFLIIGRWNYTVLLGNIYSAFFGTLNFLLMGLTVQKALGELEDMGLIETERTNGKFVTEDLALIEKERNDYANKLSKKFISNMQSIGFTKEEAIKYLEGR